MKVFTSKNVKSFRRLKEYKIAAEIANVPVEVYESEFFDGGWKIDFQYKNKIEQMMMDRYIANIVHGIERGYRQKVLIRGGMA